MSLEKPSVHQAPSGQLDNQPPEFEGILNIRHPDVDFADASQAAGNDIETLQAEQKELAFRYGKEANGVYKLLIAHLRLIQRYWKLCADLPKQDGDKRQNMWKQIDQLYSQIKQNQKAYIGLKGIRREYLHKKRNEEERESRKGESEHLAELSEALKGADDNASLEKGWSTDNNIEWNMEHALNEKQRQIDMVNRLEEEKKEFFTNYTPGSDNDFFNFAINYHQKLTKYYELLYLSHQAVLDQDRTARSDYREKAEDILGELQIQEPEYYKKRKAMEETRRNPSYQNIIANTKPDRDNDYFS